MKFIATFVSSYSAIGKLPSDGKPEIALIGRSNVGKSSLINALAERKQLAKISSTPGKTRTLNYYLVNGEFYLVDMPGYGYAKQSKSERAGWAALTEEYFLNRKELRAVGVLIDARHPGLESDMQALEWFREEGIPVFIVLTKCDKSSQKELNEHRRAISAHGSVLKIFRTSSVKGTGIAELRKFIENLTAERNLETAAVFSDFTPRV